ncbi:disulfide bond formation protein DsbB [Laceyella sacchari]|jgi:disulfide bond formation protein DsbB|uniref:disulfide bond formation protein B n=1 Tax=Laceyella sacchari TaxID=37482 RepID=UPI00105056F6|nr:disulfide bond formation protein B [Laceyella sacchari]TCW40593.1 disulfide bond formation protein DsbB [Laceyella sacchari]
MKQVSQNIYLILSLSISLVALVGSLYYSEVVGLVPCELCWYQRICMFPLPLIIVISILKEDPNVKYYTGALSLIGLTISLYQYVIQMLHTKSSFCNIASDCSSIQVQYFGFITLPLLSGFAFLLILVFSCLIKK